MTESIDMRSLEQMRPEKLDELRETTDKKALEVMIGSSLLLSKPDLKKFEKSSELVDFAASLQLEFAGIQHEGENRNRRIEQTGSNNMILLDTTRLADDRAMYYQCVQRNQNERMNAFMVASFDNTGAKPRVDIIVANVRDKRFSFSLEEGDDGWKFSESTKFNNPRYDQLNHLVDQINEPKIDTSPTQQISVDELIDKLGLEKA